MRLGLSDSFDSILYNMDRNQSALESLTTKLSTGLRITSAADDPSGLAIAESLHTVSSGLQQGITNVQTASNALTVAEGAMSSVTQALQRMRSLVVEANSDLNSPENLAAIQTEIDQLTLEINRISSNTNFNGLKLLDGSLSSTQYQPAQFLYVQNPQVGPGAGSPLIDNLTPNPGGTQISANEQTEFSFSVDSYDASTNLLQVTVKVESPDPNGPNEVDVLHVTPGAVPQGQNFFNEYGPGSAPYTFTDQAGNPVFQIAFNGLSVNDVGQEAIVVSVPAQQASTGHALEVNTGTNEGTTLSVSIGSVSAQELGVNQIVVGDVLANQAAEAKIDYGLDKIVGQRAEIGAQIVSLSEAANDASIQYINQTAAESSIRDLDVGAATTELVKEQILTQVGTSVLQQSELSTRQLASLLINALVA